MIEPSGVGKLSDVMKSVVDVEKEEDVKLNGLITVVNALKASKQMNAFFFVNFFNNQIEYATTVVLSRTQNATPEQLELCVKQIQTLNHKAAVITTPWDAIRGEQILKVVEGQDSLEMKLLAEQHAHEEHEHHHEHEEGCGCGHHHEHGEHHHEHGEGCGCGHHHEHGEHHHEHGEGCGCGHHHEHGEHHMSTEKGADADIITSMGSTTMSMEKGADAGIITSMRSMSIIMQMRYLQAGEKRRRTNTRKRSYGCFKDTLVQTDDFGVILRAKGMVEAVNGTWIYFDMLPGEYELREGEPDYTGRLCVIGTELKEQELEKLFELA